VRNAGGMHGWMAIVPTKSSHVNLPHNALIRPISARYPAGLSLRVSERILLSRLES
jgi:hypothetical protein